MNKNMKAVLTSFAQSGRVRAADLDPLIKKDLVGVMLEEMKKVSPNMDINDVIVDIHEPYEESKSFVFHVIEKIGKNNSDLKVENVISGLAKVGADFNRNGTYGTSPLFDATKQKNYTLMHSLLKNGANPNMRTFGGTTPLHEVARQDEKASTSQMLNLLVEAGADVNAVDHSGWGALYNAVHNDRADMVRSLLKLKANPNTADDSGKTPLYVALQHKLRTLHEMKSKDNRKENDVLLCQQNETIQALLNHGADSKLSNEHKVSGFHLIVACGDLELMESELKDQSLLSLVDSDKHSPVHYALRHNQLEAFKLLADKGISLGETDTEGLGLLHLVIQYQNLPFIEKLLELGLEVNEKQNGMAPIHLAAQRGINQGVLGKEDHSPAVARC